MNSKILVVFIGVSLLLGLGLAQTNINADSSKNEWSDKPMYMQGAEISISHDAVVQEKTQQEVCIEYNQTSLECLNSEVRTVPGDKINVIDFSNVNYQYLGNGEVRINFDAQVNAKLVGSQKVKNFDYFLNGENPTTTEFNNFYDSLEKVSVTPSGNSKVKASKFEGKNINSGKKSMSFVVDMQEFRSGGVKLSDFATVEVQTMNSGGGG